MCRDGSDGGRPLREEDAMPVDVQPPLPANIASVPSSVPIRAMLMPQGPHGNCHSSAVIAYYH